ncbi:proline racemase family protein [Leucobacter sp. GX24907]
MTAAHAVSPAETEFETYECVDYHTAGEPFRIVTSLPVDIEGDDVPSKRVFAMNSPEIDRIRKILCYEPRGHADMYGGFVTPPNDDGAHFGVLFWHKDGFSTACGHGTIALGAWAIESGLIEADPSGVTDVVIDVPSGRVTARVHTAPGNAGAPGQITAIQFINVVSYLLAKDVPVQTSRGEILADICFGGAIYAHVNTAQFDLAVTPENYGEVIALGREIKWLLNDTEHAKHPSDDRLSGIYGTIMFEDLGDTEAKTAAGAAAHQRNSTIFADGELDRSPCGSGTCSRVATLTARGTLPVGEDLLHESMVGSRFTARVLEQTTAEGFDAVIPQVTGMAYRTGEHLFTVDPRDELVPGFVLR